MQVPHLLQERAHLLVRNLPASKLRWASVSEGDVAARVDAPGPSSAARSDQPPVQEVRQAAFRHVQQLVAHQGDGCALIVHEVGELLAGKKHPRRAVVARLRGHAVPMPGEGPGLAVDLDAECFEGQLPRARCDLGLVGVEERRQGLPKEPAGFHRGLLGVDAGSKIYRHGTSPRSWLATEHQTISCGELIASSDRGPPR